MFLIFQKIPTRIKTERSISLRRNKPDPIFKKRGALMKGVWRKILRADLTRGSCQFENVDDAVYEKFLD